MGFEELFFKSLDMGRGMLGSVFLPIAMLIGIKEGKLAQSILARLIFDFFA